MSNNLINWSISPISYNQAVIDEVDSAVKWFNIECQHPAPLNHENLRFAVQNEISKLQYEKSSKKLIFAIFALYYQGYLPDPKNIQFDDIENARWVIQNPKYGFPTAPSNQKLKGSTPSQFTF